jgi:thiosulfate/3-mercaptopyruvate sulfurtransferase
VTSPLIGVAELNATLSDPVLRLADIRWYLDEPDRGRAGYDAGHIAGAVFVDLDRDLTAPRGPGRHPLRDRVEFAAAMGRVGFGDAHRIVVYDDRGGIIAARLWWMLRDIGHDAVRVLDGGINAWTAAGHSAITAPTPIAPATLTVRPARTRQIDRETLADRLGTVTVLDARAPERYRGEVEPIDPVAGHIPTALNAPAVDNLGADGRLLPPAELAKRYRGLSRDRDVVASCGSGVFACHDILAMTVAGLPEPILYPGSWSDWSTAGMPAAVGEEPGTWRMEVES